MASDMDSPTVNDIPWPPKSPHQALISSPSGRKKYERIQNQRRNANTLSGHGVSPSKASQLLNDHVGDDDDDDDDDEETLQLKLAAIEARLKLKKLQNKNGMKTSSFEGSNGSFSNGASDIGSFSSQQNNHFSADRKRKAADMTYEENIQVPLSPMKPKLPASHPVSPKRIVLGIDKGIKGADVALRRRPNSGQSMNETKSFTTRRTDGNFQRGPHRAEQASPFPYVDQAPRPKSFSDRIREGRSSEKDRREKALRAQKKRSRTFDIDPKEVEGFHEAAAQSRTESTNEPMINNRQTESFSRDDIIQSYNRPISALRRNNPTPSSSGGRQTPKYQSDFPMTNTSTTPAGHRTGTPNGFPAEDSIDISNKPPDATKFEPFSALHLANRILPHSFLTRTLESKTSMRIPDLLKQVKGPDFDLPETIDDYVVFGIVASKSAPKDHKDKKNGSDKKDPYDDGTNNASKYMVLTLTDLTWTIDLFLFATAFPRYYKLSPGTLIAILNPSIMPPPRHKIDTNAFSLTLSSSEDTILEIGTAQNIGFCKAVKKDGKVCESWVDGRKTEYCDFHVDIQLRRTTGQRMEVNKGPGTGSRSGYRSGAPYTKGSRPGAQGSGGGPGPKKNREGGVYDRGTGSTYYVAPSQPNPANMNTSLFSGRHRSAASLLDAEDPFISAGSFNRGGDTKADRLRKRLADQERERNIARQLGEFKGVGAEYLRTQYGSADVESASANATGGSQGSMAGREGLMGLDNLPRKATNVKLGPMKKAALATSRSKAPAERPPSPSKKTRFITANGIREAGRDSLGRTTDGMIDYDDDLDII